MGGEVNSVGGGAEAVGESGENGEGGVDLEECWKRVKEVGEVGWNLGWMGRDGHMKDPGR